jgi:hypothetical protein
LLIIAEDGNSDTCFGQHYYLVPYRKNSLYVAVDLTAHELYCTESDWAETAFVLGATYLALRLCTCIDSWYYYYYCVRWVCIQYFSFGGGTVAEPAAIYGGTVAESAAIYGGTVAEPVAIYGGTVAEPAAIYGGTVAEPEAIYGGTVAEPAAIYGGTVAEPVAIY